MSLDKLDAHTGTYGPSSSLAIDFGAPQTM